MVQSAGLLNETVALRQCALYRNAFRASALSYPADVLHSAVVTDWVKRKGVSVGVASAEDLDLAVSREVGAKYLVMQCLVGTDPAVVRRALTAGVTRFVVGTEGHITALAAPVRQVRHVVVDSDQPGWEELAARVVAQRGMSLTGLYRELPRTDDAGGADALIAMIAGMARRSRRHGVIMGRLSLGGLRTEVPGDIRELRRVAEMTDEVIGDGCALCRYPRPALMISPTLSALATVR